ncbi:glycosyl transferase [Thermaurantimonas aggregans]|uniref:Glycosyl transferase n=1 Tax=Thermaurantimonas aggregans TaxID=2173829 RepID=A0A401XK37_9FLAO|nr:glycosyltransferase family 4 protein [Thermaurantimonas aggregans]GCD77344.1 glycosyl transferase [Thermaurantimonas aggregans]
MVKLKKNKKLKILLLPGAFHSPSARFRIWQFVEPLKASGYEVVTRVPIPDRNYKGRKLFSNKWEKIPIKIKSIIRLISSMWMLRDLRRFDYVIANRDIVPDVKIKFLEKIVILSGVKFIFDFDDAIHLGAREKKLSEFLPACYYITPGNAYLAEYAQKLNNNVKIIPTVVNTEKYKPISFRKPGKLRIGWSGSSSTNIYCLPILKNVIETLSFKHDFEFIIISDKDPKINWIGVQSKFLLWRPETEITNLQHLDIGLMPLNDSPFERGKCGLKAIQYMALGKPALVSPVGVNAEIVTHGVDGFHCYNEADWIKYIETLILNPDLLIDMGKNARIKIESKYSVDYAMNIWKSILL